MLAKPARPKAIYQKWSKLMDEKLTDLLHDLHYARIGTDEANIHMKSLVEQVKLSNAYKEAQEVAWQCMAATASLTQLINQASLAQFAADKEKHPHSAIEIKEFDIVTVRSQPAAREWCFNNLRPALKLDVKVFEKFAKTGNVPAELASVTKEPRVQIASDLSKFL